MLNFGKKAKISLGKKLLKNNVTVINPDISDFRKAVIPMHEALAKRDSKSKELIDYIKNYGL